MIRALALHSCSDSLGVAVCQGDARASAAFPLGRSLANGLFTAVESLLPAAVWPQLSWLAVATGPGGFTGTRLTVVMARTLAQQLNVPLYGFGSFALVARRRRAELAALGPHWIGQTLARRGVVAGHYALPEGAGEQPGLMLELEAPRLWSAAPPAPLWEVQMDAEADALQLLDLGQQAWQAGEPGPWGQVLPCYPTSPVPESPP